MWALFDIKHHVNQLAFIIGTRQRRDVRIGVALVRIDISDNLNPLAQLASGENIARIQPYQSQQFLLVPCQIALDVNSAHPVLRPFINMNKQQHVLIIIDQRDNRFVNLHTDVTFIKIKVSNSFKILLQQKFVVIAAIRYPGKDPFLLGIHRSPDITFIKDRISIETNILDTNDIPFLDAEGNKRFILLIDMAIGSDFRCVIAFHDIGDFNLFDTVVNFKRIVNIRDFNSDDFT